MRQSGNHSDDKHPSRTDGNRPTAILEFLRTEAGSGVVLILAAVVAIIWANSQWSDRYEEILHTSFSIGTVANNLTMSVQHWINDGLMVVFFLVVGLEIKRELLIGELSSRDKAAIPVAAALGGAIVPAVIFLLATSGSERNGWGIPMATDIAFALGVLALIGSNAPIGLRIFLMALAIVDDLLAIIVIAIFYTESIRFDALFLAGACLVVLALMNRFQIAWPALFAVVGIVLWFGLLKSGVHATIAGVLIALCIPVSNSRSEEDFVADAQRVIDEYSEIDEPHQRGEAVLQLEILAERATPPAQRLIHSLHPWVAYMIVPIFALANAGLEFGNSGGITSVSVGIVLGLVLGKPIGIAIATLAMMRLKIGTLPEGMTFRDVPGLGALAGIGFTMSLFITDLAFDDVEHVNQAKSGILVASVVAAIVGSVLIWRTGRMRNNEI